MFVTTGERGKVSAANQTRLGGQWNVLVDVRLGGEIVWITSGVGALWSLIHLRVVDRDNRRKGQVFGIDGSGVKRNSQVDDHILEIRETPNR